MELLFVSLLFICGFIASRLLVKNNIAHRLVNRFIKLSNGNVLLTVLYLMLCASMLSIFIPNMITLLALLPILKELRENLSSENNENSHLMTLMGLAAIYGSNIGGLGSIIGSPANYIAISALEGFNTPGREGINFISWILWGFPLVIVFISSSWIILALFNLKLLRLKINSLTNTNSIGKMNKIEKISIYVILSIFIFWILISILQMVYKNDKTLTISMLILCICFTLLLIAFVLLKLFTNSEKVKTPLLKFKDSYSGIPTKGLLFIIGATLIGVVLYFIKVHEWIAQQITSIIPENTPDILLYLPIAIITTFSTELLSNTVTAIAFFPIVYSIALANSMNPIIPIMIVSLASTCAFMTPLATPVNALAFGSNEGTSLKNMMIIGFFVNILGSILITLTAVYLMPIFFNL